MKWRDRVFVLAAFLFGSFFVVPVFASASPVIISKIAAHEPSGFEWIEVRNISTSTIDMLDWKFLEAGTNHRLSVVSGSSTLAVGEVAVIAQDGELFASTTSSTVLDSSWGTLKESGEEIGLVNGEGVIVEKFVYPMVEALLVRQCELCDPGVTSTWVGVKQDADGVMPDLVVTTTPIAATSTSSTVEITTTTSPIVETPASPLPTQYAPGTIVINEFVSNPSEGNQEFVELKNATDSTIDVDGWWIEDESKRKTMLGGVIDEFMVAQSPKGRLNNSGDSIFLFDPSGGIIDSVVYGDGVVEAPGKGESVSLFGAGWSVSLVATPGEQNELVEERKEERVKRKETQHSDVPEMKKEMLAEKPEEKEIYIDYTGLIITEVFPNPDGPDISEYVVIQNASKREIDVFGLVIDDEKGGSKPHKVDVHVTLAPGNTYVIDKQQSKITLNNSSDEVRLLDALGESVDEMQYGFTVSGERLVLQDDEFVWTVSQEAAAGKPSDVYFAVSELAELEVGAAVSTVGTVSVLPGVYGSQYFYIVSHDRTSGEVDAGVQVYKFDKQFPALKVGDVVEVRGEVSQTKQGARVKLSRKEDVRVVGRQDVRASAHDVSDIDETMVGQLVQVHGEITEKNGRSLFVDDGSAEIKVYMKNGVSVDRATLKVGGEIAVVGTIVKGSAGLQLLPRSQEDITLFELDEEVLVVSSTPIAHIVSTSEESSSLPASAAAGAGSFALALVGRKYGRQAVEAVVGLMRRG